MLHEVFVDVIYAIGNVMHALDLRQLPNADFFNLTKAVRSNMLEQAFAEARRIQQVAKDKRDE